MKLENREFLDTNRHHYTTLVNAGYVQHLDQHTRENILRIIHEEFAPGYLAQLWCQSCVADLIKFAYVQYDKWIAVQPKDEPIVDTPAEPERDHVRMTFPIQEALVQEPIDVNSFGKIKGNVKAASKTKPVGGTPPKAATKSKKK